MQSSISTPYEAWKHFITEKMLRNILKYTKKQAERVGDDKFELTIQELETFIGLQYARGVYGKNHPIEFLWSKEFGIPQFRNSMPQDRFKTILKHLCFDDRTKVSERNQQNDKFAPIRDLFDEFVKNCKTKYVCDFSLNVDEQLLSCKNRCGFISFMPNKPDKYGIKFWFLADVNTKFILNINPYLGAQDQQHRGRLPVAMSIILDLTKDIYDKGCNITCDNFFGEKNISCWNYSEIPSGTVIR